MSSSYAQLGKRSDRQLEKDKKYEVMIGTNKTNASFNNTDGFTIKENDIRIVGFLHRHNKIEYDKIYVRTKRDTTVVDEQTMKGRSINASWKDFYIKLKDLVPSDNYRIEVYSEPERKLVASKEFYIKKKE
ncbi:MAG: hypothetical protein B7Y15_14785 [Bacteroidetes bacterium 24-39-8]|jgi:hypothetical protein|nr:MAG: hypothetical protein B7Y15_14785 [Bacteroidetes bacterium 24-39-8]OZA62463.1 MAG: hypothetical protein B7X72_11955 [Sphingobacteriia bacterium 39-39-8]